MSTNDGPVGLPVPDEYVGAFVAEVFEDVERSTTWEEAVDALVAAAARSAWDGLSPVEQVVAMLDAADGFDERGVETLEAIPLDGQDGASVRDEYEEARRFRRNADMLRNGVADAYSSGHVDDDQLIQAVERHGFESDTIARREELLESIAETHGLEFRPYGGTLMEPPGTGAEDPAANATFDIETR